MYSITSRSVGEYKGLTIHKTFATRRAARCAFTKLIKKLKTQYKDMLEFNKYYVQLIPHNYGWNNFNDETFEIVKR